MKAYERHPLSELWGDMGEDEFQELVESIDVNGQLLTIILHEEMVLEGWHRYRACLRLGRKPVFQQFPEHRDPVAYVIAMNATRRHLTASQRAACVVAARKWAARGRPAHPEESEKQDSESYFRGSVDKADSSQQDSESYPSSATASSPDPVSEKQMADEAGVSERMIRRAKRAEREGFGEKVRSGEITLNEAERIAKGKGEEPKPPTATERLRSKIEALEEEIEHLQTQNALLREEANEQTDLIRFHEGNMSEHEHERHEAYASLQAQLSTANSQVATWMNKFNDEQRSRKYWERQAKQLGWKKATA